MSTRLGPMAVPVPDDDGALVVPRQKYVDAAVNIGLSLGMVPGGRVDWAVISEPTTVWTELSDDDS